MIRVIALSPRESFHTIVVISGILASFSDIQTVLFACASTLLPLIIALGVAFGVRYAKCRSLREKTHARSRAGRFISHAKRACNRDDKSLPFLLFLFFSFSFSPFLPSLLMRLSFCLVAATPTRYVWRKYRNDGDSENGGLPWLKSACTRGDIAAESQHPHSENSVPVQAATRVLSAQDVS